MPKQRSNKEDADNSYAKWTPSITKQQTSFYNISCGVRKMKNKWALYKELFLSTLYLSAFTFGGGYVIVTMMKQKFCDELHYIDEKEMLDLIAIAQSAPGGHRGQWRDCPRL